MKISQNKIHTIKKNIKKKPGFTLIELMTVIAIIAILATAFLPKISRYFDEAKKVAILNEAKSVVTAFESTNIRRSTPLSETTKISDLVSMPNSLLLQTDIVKITKDATVLECKQMLDTEKYSFSITNGQFTDNNTVTPYKVNQ